MERRKETRITVTQPWGASGWIKGEVLGGSPEGGERYSFSAKVYGEPSALYGIRGGRGSKLAIYREEPVRKCVLNYDRCWDIELEDEATNAVFCEVLAFLEALSLTE